MCKNQKKTPKGLQKRNRDVVLNCLKRMDSNYFKTKTVVKQLNGELNNAQIRNAFKVLRAEGIIQRYNESYTWTWTKKDKTCPNYSTDIH